MKRNEPNRTETDFVPFHLPSETVSVGFGFGMATVHQLSNRLWRYYPKPNRICNKKNVFLLYVVNYT